MKIRLILLITSIIILVNTFGFVVATEFTEPGTYEVQPGDIITFNEVTVQVIDIKTNDRNVSWNQDFGREMVYLGTPGLGFYAYLNEKIELIKAKHSLEKPIVVIVNSVDLENKKAEVKFIDNYVEGCTEKFEKTCYNVSVYWVDSCGRRGEFIERCGNKGCEGHGRNAECIGDENQDNTNNQNQNQQQTKNKCPTITHPNCPDKTELEEEKDSNGCIIKNKCMKKLSNGKNAEVKIMPETASQKAIQRLGELNFTIELKEVGKGDKTKPIYELTGKKNGKFLGIFKIQARVQTQIDAETGEIIKTTKPWWSFLATGI
jgi:hypothetical protein